MFFCFAAALPPRPLYARSAQNQSATAIPRKERQACKFTVPFKAWATSARTRKGHPESFELSGALTLHKKRQLRSCSNTLIQLCPIQDLSLMERSTGCSAQPGRPQTPQATGATRGGSLLAFLRNITLPINVKPHSMRANTEKPAIERALN